MQKFITTTVQRCRGVSEQWCNDAECIIADVQLCRGVLEQRCSDVSEQQCKFYISTLFFLSQYINGLTFDLKKNCPSYLSGILKVYHSRCATVQRCIREAVQRCWVLSEQWCNGADVYQSNGATVQRYIRAVVQRCRMYHSRCATVQRCIRAAVQRCIRAAVQILHFYFVLSKPVHKWSNIRFSKKTVHQSYQACCKSLLQHFLNSYRDDDKTTCTVYAKSRHIRGKFARNGTYLENTSKVEFYNLFVLCACFGPK